MRKNLIAVRKARDMTQKELGQMVGLSKQSISDLETGRVKGKVKTWQALAKLFKTKPEKLWQESEPDSAKSDSDK